MKNYSDGNFLQFHCLDSDPELPLEVDLQAEKRASRAPLCGCDGASNPS